MWYNKWHEDFPEEIMMEIVNTWYNQVKTYRFTFIGSS